MARIYTEEEIRQITKSVIGKTFKELQLKENDSTKNSKANKAFFGHLLETDVFKMKINSYSLPDFKEAGIELKVTPYKKKKNKTLVAKERLVLNIIDYMSEYKNTFETSHFLAKNKRLQIIWYLWEKNKNKEDLQITNELLYTFPNDDMPIIKKDWEYIIQKIRDGKAQEISEADTMYLGACTKGVNNKSKRAQPNSDIKAKQRAFCFKKSYMTSLVQKYIGNCKAEKVLKQKEESFSDYMQNVIDKYKDKTKTELMKELKVKSSAKNVLNMLINRMFNVKSKLKDTDEFIKANIVPKTIRVEENGRIKESMSFPYFKFTEIIKDDFEDSDLKEKLETTKYMFFIFKKINGEYVFKGIKLWNMPEVIIETKIKEMYEKTQEIIRTGNIVKYVDKKGRRFTNFPKLKDNGVCHVRPHGRNSLDTTPLPVKDKVTKARAYTKQCFWLNNSYVKEIISEFLG